MEAQGENQNKEHVGVKHVRKNMLLDAPCAETSLRKMGNSSVLSGEKKYQKILFQNTTAHLGKKGRRFWKLKGKKQHDTLR